MTELFESLSALSSNLGWGAVAGAATVVHFFVEPSRWWLLVTRQGGLKYLTTLHIFNTTALMSYTLPFKMGMPVRHSLLKRFLGSGHLFIGSTLLLDTVLVYSLWGLASVLTLSVTRLAVPFEASIATLWLLGVIVVSVIVTVVIKARKLQIRSRLASAWLELRPILTARAGLVAALSVVLDIGAQGVKHWAVLELLGIEIGLGLSVAIAIMSITTGLFSFLPLGLGAYDAVFLALASAAFGSSEGVWIAPIVVRGLNLGVAAIVGSVGAAALGLKLRSIVRSDGKLEP